jgi:hypothetical protein
VSSVLSALRPRDDDLIFDPVGSYRKLHMALPLSVMVSPFECCSLVEGVPKMIHRIELMDSVPLPHAAPLGGPALGKLLL